MASMDDIFRESLGPRTPTPNAAANEELGYQQGVAKSVGLRSGNITDDYWNNMGTWSDAAQIEYGRRKYMDDAANYRSNGEAAGDRAVGILNAVAQGVLGVGGAAGSVVDWATGDATNIGGAISGFSEGVNGYADSLKSKGLRSEQRAKGARDRMTSEHNKALAQEEIAKGSSPLVANLRRIGRDFTRGITNGSDMTFNDGVMSGVGSFALGGIMGKGLSRLGAGRAAMPISIGALEGGGAYTQTVNEVMAMSHEELMAGSDDYVDLINLGVDPEKAKSEIANKAGRMAAAIQAPIGVATGALVSKFEGNPLTSARSMKAVLGNLTRETVEESIQGGAGAFSANAAMQSYANRDQDMVDGIGQGAGEGALYGLGTAGVAQVPGLPLAAGSDAWRATKAVGRAAKAVAQPTIDRVRERGRQLNEQFTATMEQARQQASNDFAAARERLINPNLAADVAEALRKRNAPEETVAKVDDYVNNIRERIQIDAEAEASTVKSSTIADAIRGSSDRFDAVSRVADIILDEKSSDSDRLDAGRYIMDQIQKNTELFNNDVSVAIGVADDSDPLLPELRGYEATIGKLINEPKVQEALNKALQSTEAMELEDTQRILYHAEQGDIELTPEGRQLIESRQALLETEAEAEATKVENHPNIISKAIRRKGDDKEAGFKAGREYEQDIVRAWRRGDKEGAKAELRNLWRFASHLQNKLAAINDQLVNGTGLEEDGSVFTAYNAKSKKRFRSRIYLNPENPNSVRLAQQIEADARAMTRLYNKMGTIFSELGVPQLEETALDDSLKGSPEKVGSTFRGQKWGETRRQGKPSANRFEERSGQQAPDESVPAQVESKPEQPARDEQVATPEAKPTSEVSRSETETESKPAKESKIARKIPTTKAEYTKYIKSIVNKAGKGRLETRPAYPEEMAEGTEKGMYRFGYRTQDNVLVEGNYRIIDGKELAAFDIGDTSNPVQMSGPEIRSLIKQLSEAHPDVDYFEAYRISGARNEKQMIWAIKGDDGKLRIRLKDPRAPLSEDEAIADIKNWDDGQISAVLRDYLSLSGGGESNPRMWIDALEAEQARRQAEADKRKAEEAKPEAKAEPKVESKPEPKPEPAPEPEPAVQPLDETKAEETPAKPQSVMDKLHEVAGKVTNWFKESFRPVEGISRLANNPRPFRAVFDALATPDSWKAAVGEKAGTRLKKEWAGEYRQFLKDNYEQMAMTLSNRLQEALQQTRKGPDGKPITLKQDLTEGTLYEGRLTAFRNFRTFNLLEKDEDGDFNHNQQLLELALLAGLQWAVTAKQQLNPLDAEQVAKILGVREDQVTETHLSFFQNNYIPSSATQQLANVIQQFWGVKRKKDSLNGHTQGIVQAMASEVLVALEEAGLIEIDSSPTQFFGKDYVAIRPVTNEQLTALRAAPTVIEQIVLVEPKPVYFFGSAPTDQKKNQLHAPRTPLAPAQRAMIERERQVPYRINPAMLAFYKGLGTDAIVSLFGGGTVVEGQTNKNHAVRVESQNTVMRNGFETLENMIAVMTAADQDPLTTDIFYDYEVSNVGRLQMQGPNNPQANKLMREVVLPTQQTVDMTDPKMLRLFKVALAQHWGLKTDRANHEQLEASVNKMIDGELAPLLQMLEAWDKNGQKPFSPEDIELIRSSFKGKPSPAALHAAIEYARYMNTENPVNFVTTTYIEADGKTDGPINALMNMSSGRFTKAWLLLMEKGGFFVGGRNRSSNGGPMTLNEYAQTDEGDLDLYGEAAAATSASWNRLIRNVEGVSKQQHIHLRNLLDELGLGVSLTDEGEIEISRGLTKNPLTITTYGSGKRGIAGNIAQAIITQIYENMSDGTRLSEAGRNALQTLTSFQLKKLKDGSIRLVPYVRGKKVQLPRREESTNALYTFTDTQVDMLTENILKLFVEGPLSTGIDAVMGDTVESVTAMRQAVQLQSIFQQWMFLDEAHKLLETKASPTDGLTDEELDAVWKKVEHLGPLLDMGNQIFMTAKSDKADLRDRMKVALKRQEQLAEDRKAYHDPNYEPKKIDLPNDIEFSATLDDKLRTPGTLPAPMNSGVGAIPRIVIGTGDGQMIQIFSADPTRPNSLLVFDGVNFGLLDIEAGSVAVNKAVADGWLNSKPLTTVARMFTQMLDNVDLSEMPEDMLKELAKVFVFGEEVADFQPEDLMTEMRELSKLLDSLALSAESRKNALKRIGFGVDHMATAMSPYAHEGVELEGDLGEIAVAMEAIRQEELAKLKETSSVRPKTKTLDALRPTDGSKLRTMSVRDLRLAIRNNRFDSEHKSVIDSTLRQLDGSGYEIIVGSLEDILSERQAAGLPPIDIRNGVTSGFNLPDEKRLYLVNPSSEVLAHELIHAATFNTVAAYYDEAGKAKLSTEQRDAVARIEAMMKEWMTRYEAGEFETPDGILADAMRNLNNVLTSALNKGDMAEAVNEFMAWGLTNRPLINKGKMTAVKSALVRIADALIESIKKLIWPNSRPPVVGKDFYSNLRFNTQILVEQSQTVQDVVARSVQFHLSNSTNERLKTIQTKLANKVAMHINTKPSSVRSDMKTRFQQSLTKANETARSFIDRGFPMGAQEHATFKMMVAALATEIEVDPNALSRMQDLYTAAIDQLTEESFMVDPAANNFADRQQAQEKLDVLTGSYTLRKDGRGRTQLLPSFVALATINEEFRAVLNKLDLPKSEKNKENTLNAQLENIGTSAMDWVGKWASGVGNARTMDAALDALTDRVIENLSEEQGNVMKAVGVVGTGVDKINDMAVKLMQQGSEKLVQASTNLKNNSSNKLAQLLGSAGQVIGTVVNEKRSAIAADGVVAAMNKSDAIPRFFREMMVEVVGRTASNAKIYDMIKRVRSYVQQTRQQFRDNQPKIIRNAFKQKLDARQWKAMTDGLAKTDLAALLDGGMSIRQVTDLLGNGTAIRNAISRLETEIQQLGPTYWNQRQAKAKELATYMVTGKVPASLLRNARAVAELLGEVSPAQRNYMSVNAEMVDKLDQLISLYALQQTDADTINALSSLVQTEAEGMDFVLSFLKGQRKDEMAKATGNARYNYHKGRVPLENDSGGSLKVASDRDRAKLEMLGYTRVGDYEGMAADRADAPMGYYHTPVNPRSQFKQGIMQNVRRSAYGVSPFTGYTMDASVSGVINDPRQVVYIRRRMAANARAEAPLLPVFNTDGEMVAFERSVSPEQQARLKPNEDMAEVLGIWRGRQAEEHYATSFNYELIRNLAGQWQSERRTKADEYIDLFSREAQKDPVIRDAVRLITPDAREEIKEHFRDGTFMVRKDLINDAIGYRSVSIGDSFTGVSRLKPEVQRAVRETLLGTLGKDAFRKVVHAERLYQTVVSDAKVTIVVKSVIVPAFNIASNVVHLASRGVPLKNIVQGFGKKTAEVDAFLKGRLKRMSLEAQERAAEAKGDQARVRQLRTEIQSIQDANRRLSIWPLIEAGELASISDTGLSHEDVLLTEGKISEYMEKLTERLPPELQTFAKYGLVSRDTALFKGMQKAVEYGDFLAKAVLYDDLIKRQGKTHEYALGRVTEEFINYDRQPGRGRGYLEDMGVLWFWNFKMRAIKVAMATMRHNPVHALLAGLAPLPDGIGTPITDNMLSVIFDGRLGYSVGVDQLLHAHALNPWVNLTS